MLKKLLLTSVLAGASFAATTSDLESRVEALEFAGYENWWKFSGSLEYRFDSVERTYNKAYTSSTFSGTSIARTKGEVSNTKHHRVFSELDMEAKPSDKLTFYGRLSASKYMNTLNKGGGNYAGDGAFNELFEGQGMGNSSVFLERAFVNYSLTNTLTFSLGRLPTIDGSPKHFAEGRSMMGQYPLLAFGGIFDGIALTYAKEVMGGTFKLRGIYTPFNQRNLDSVTDKLADGTNEIDDSVDVYSAMLEFEKANLSWAKRVHFIYQYLTFDGLAAIPNSKSYIGSTTSGAMLGLITTSNATLGAERHVAYLEVNGIAQTGLSMAFSYLNGTTKGGGNMLICADSPADGNYDGNCDATVSNVGTWYGDKAGEHDGSAWIVNLNYQIARLNSAIVGFEYMDSDADAFLYDSASKNLVGEYTSRGGNSMHAYWIQPVDNRFKVRVGYQSSNATATNSLGGYLGKKLEVDNDAKAYYTSLQFTF